MESIIEFAKENYVWIIIVGVIILMTIIGYIADKTEFGKNKPVKEKKEKGKKEKKKKEKDEIFEEEPEEVVENNEEKIPSEIETAEDDFDIETNAIQTFDTDELDINEENSSNEEPSEDLYVGLDGTPDAYKEEKVSDELLGDNAENLEIELPSIDTLNQELQEEAEEDDVWKF